MNAVSTTVCKKSNAAEMGVFERYLTVWVFLCIVAGIEDPAAFKGKFHEKLSVFEQVYRELERRIERLIDLPLDKLSPAQLQNSLEEIAK